MNNVSRNRVLVTIIAILLLSNIVLLALLLKMHPPHEDAKPGFTERLKKEVGFTPQQMQVFEPKKQAFWTVMRQKFDSIKVTKEKFYFLIYDSTVSDSVMQMRAEIIGEQQKDLDMQVIRHFKEVRKICTHDQLPKYDSLVPYVIQRMTSQPARRK